MPSRELIYAATLGFALSLSVTSWIFYKRIKPEFKREDVHKLRSTELRPDEIFGSIIELIGNTPLVRINSLSNALGINILGKAEYLNPGGSVKDRVALKILDNAESQGLLKPHTGSCIFEGTSGSTGISFATIAGSRGYKTTIIMPDDVSDDKTRLLIALGAKVEKVRPASIVDKKQFVNIARQRVLDFGEGVANEQGIVSDDSTLSIGRMENASIECNPSHGPQAENAPRGFFADQFENTANYEAHFEGTGPEIFRQTNGNVTAFVSGAGTGGTIAGVGNFLKSQIGSVIICLADPEGSGLHNKIKYGVLFDVAEREGTRRRHQIDTVVEGIGLNRMTKNVEKGLPVIDESFRVTDVEAIAMSRYIAQHDGLFLGSSSAVNLVACVRLAKSRGWRNGEKIVTILCDSGSRHFSKFWNDEYLRKAKLPVDRSIIEDLLNL